MNIRNIHDNVIQKNISLTTLLKLQVDTISSEYVEKIHSNYIEHCEQIVYRGIFHFLVHVYLLLLLLLCFSEYTLHFSYRYRLRL